MPGWNESLWFSIFMGAALKSTMVLGVAWMAVVLLRRRSAALRHLVWTAAAAAVLALPFLSISLPPFQLRAGSMLAAPVGVLFQTTAFPRAGMEISKSAPESSLATKPRQAAPWRPDWRGAMMLLWAAGSLAAVMQMLGACIGMWRLRRSAKPLPDSRLSQELARSLGIRNPVDVFASAGGTMPMTFGILRPAVFLPCDAADWTEERRRIVLLHELAHVRRGDNATQLLARLALILNWWNPLAWTAWREFLKERERATDDLVLQTGARASDYAGHLLEVARSRQFAPALGWVAVAMARRSQLEGRLLAILDSTVNRQTAGRASAFATALVAVALVAPLAAVRGQDKTSAALSADVDATIRAAIAQRNHEMLEKPAASFEESRQYETAQKLLESAVAIREQVSGSRSVEYGLGLIKLGNLEKRRNRHDEAAAFFSKAAEALGGRPEAAPALMYLGIANLRQKDLDRALDYFQKARSLEPSLDGPAMMWMAVIEERKENAQEAEAMYKSALAAENPESADAANTLALYARFLQQTGREEEGRAMQDRLAAIHKSLLAQSRGEQKTGVDVFRVGGDVKPPSVLSKEQPQYSEEARTARFVGTVLVYAEIGPDGRAHNMRVERGLGFGLDESAIDAIGKWTFKPGTKDGNAVTVAAKIEVNFRLL